MIDKKNITISEILEKKKEMQLIIENIQHQNSNEVDSKKIANIIHVNKVVKPYLTEINKIK